MKKLLSITLLLLGFISISNAQQISIDDTVTIKNEKYIVKKIDRRGIFHTVQKIENKKNKTVHINRITVDKEKQVSLKLGMSGDEVRNILKSSYKENIFDGTWGELTFLQYETSSTTIVFLVFEEDRLVSIMQEK